MSDQPPKTLQVSAAQMHWARPLERNMELTGKFIGQAAAEGSRVLLLPESSITGYYLPYAVTLSRETVLAALDEVCRLAAASAIWVIAGSIRKWKDTFLNLAHVIDPSGTVTYEYAKVQMAGEDERKYCTPGNKVAFFQIDGIDCAMSICRDGRHPELFRIPAMMGARIFFQPSCSSEHVEAVAWKRVSGRAQQAAGPKSYIHHVVANTVGQSPDAQQTSSGQSFIRDCTGLPLAEAGFYEETLISAVLDLDKSTGFYARQSAEHPAFLRRHWQAMMDAVRKQAGKNPEDE
ncbi:MAG: carbon-nitrogen hydrolase family protein [Candidatus Glassbacteria bacterium]|nr:carbon-nitrogen hydrolase family protein [Candidatus Glassbacteria bacterium]